MEKITVDLIAHKEFSISSKGYDQAEVDNFLDDICEEMERMEKEIMDLRQKTTAVRPAAPAPAGGVSEDQENSFREVLQMAMQVKEDTIRKAKDGLSDRRDALKGEIAELKAAAADYRAKFETLLQAQQEALEKAADLF